MEPFELAVHRSNTSAFIAHRPTTLALVPVAERERTPSGGWIEPQAAPRSPQIFRIIELGANVTPPVLVLADGKQREAEFLLLGEWDAAVEVGDSWVAADGRNWEVGDIVRDNGYEVRALVAERGR